MPGRTIAIGDIHGCSQALQGLLEAISPTSDDTIITLGDYVDRGPNTRGVIDQLILLRDRCQLIPLMGNHEEMMLEVVRDGEPPYRWLQFGGVDTLDSYGFSGDVSVIPDDHLDFFSRLEDYFETDDWIFVHANYDANLPLDQQPENLLRWVKLSQSMPAPHFSGKRVCVGHTHDRGGEIFSVGHLTCLDTYCYGGFWLTAMDVNSGQLWQVDPEGQIRP